MTTDLSLRTRTLLALTAAILAAACNHSLAPDSRRVSAWDGMTLLYVPAGPFWMGSSDTDPAREDDELPQRSVTLSAFWIDQTEVTNRLYRRCVDLGPCRAPEHSPAYDSEAQEDHPVLGVTWAEAEEYCQWAGRRLPTEAEWEKAARGTDGRIYPWGDDPPDERRANFNGAFGGTTPVGQFPDGVSPYGALDMAGNAWEWTADAYDSVYYATAPTVDPRAELTTVNLRVIRGGSWNTFGPALRGANRFWAFPGRDDFDGFRCASEGQ